VEIVVAKWNPCKPLFMSLQGYSHDNEGDK
jgi:hypothetical protein